MMPKEVAYIPALKYSRLTPLYDPLLRFILREATWKPELVKQAQIANSQRILDVGCGTATLPLLIKQMYPEATVFGLDGDPQILEIARAKVAHAQVEVVLTQSMSSALPYLDGTFDRVLSSLFFHHLTRANKERTLKEILRVLRPGGELHLADWGKAQDPFMRFAFLGIQILDGFETTAEHVSGILPDLCLQAGFQEVQQTHSYRTLFGTLSFYQARKPKEM
jgi:ubiquinone/menaquinone biosynthesis C-methylase UbiE